ncbi:MAG: DUF981 family protein [Actinomycetes bacterium]
MVLYNTLMGVAAGAAMVMVPLLAHRLGRREQIGVQGWALSFGVLGVILAVLGALMATTWPLSAKPQVNILFGEPTFFLGLLLLAAALYLWTHAAELADLDDAGFDHLIRVVEPVSWLVFVLGLILAACTITVFRFTAIGGAPPAEPIMGTFADSPWVENTLVGLFYALAAVGTLLAPWAVRKLGGPLARVAGWCMIVGGVALLLYSAMNYYTHIGLEMGM